MIRQRSQQKWKNVKKKLLDQVRDIIRLKHYSIRTEKAYVNWIRRLFCSITVVPPNAQMAIEYAERISNRLLAEGQSGILQKKRGEFP